MTDDAKPTEAAAECVNAMSDMIRDMISNAVQAERDRVVAYLRQNRIDWPNVDTACYADAIQAGEHLK